MMQLRMIQNLNSFVINMKFLFCKFMFIEVHCTIVNAVERGLTELRKLGIERQLWEASRREMDEEPSAEGH
jgi:hypothetical protein